MRNETFQWLVANAPHSLLEAMAWIKQDYVNQAYDHRMIVLPPLKSDQFTLDRIDA